MYQYLPDRAGNQQSIGEVDRPVIVIALPAKSFTNRAASQSAKPLIVRDVGLSVMRADFMEAEKKE